MAKIGINPDTSTYTPKQVEILTKAFGELEKSGKEPSAEDIAKFVTDFNAAGKTIAALAGTGIPNYVPQMAEIGVNPDLTAWSDAQIGELLKVVKAVTDAGAKEPTKEQVAAFKTAWDGAATGDAYITNVTAKDIEDGSVAAKIETAPESTTVSLNTVKSSQPAPQLGGLAQAANNQAEKSSGGGDGGKKDGGKKDAGKPKEEAAATEDAESKAAGFAASVAMIMALSTVAGI